MLLLSPPPSCSPSFFWKGGMVSLRGALVIHTDFGGRIERTQKLPTAFSTSLTLHLLSAPSLEFETPADNQEP